MSGPRRRELVAEVLAGYVHGPAAATEATARALGRVAEVVPDTVILVEGISDQIAVETAARRRGRDLEGDRTVVVPVGGAHGVGRFIERFGAGPGAVRLLGLFDAAEEEPFRLGLARVGLGSPEIGQDLAGLGFHVCVDDLEDELIRAVGLDRAEDLLASQGDLKPFRTMQRQPAWRGRRPEAQLRRFLGSGARRKLRYARLLVEAIDPDRIPEPLTAVLDPG